MPSSGVAIEPSLSFLDEPLICWRDTHATVQHGSLPELLAALAANGVRDFPRLRPHQRHPWHAFLVQLAAIALHHAGQNEPWTSDADWRAALLALTPDDADGAAWCLVAAPERPALLQAPVLHGIDDWDAEVHSPDRLDMIGTSKNHDLKRARARQAGPDDWLFALVSLQTQAGSNSGSYKGISRMNSGAGSRPGIGVMQKNSAWGQRWKVDLSTLQKFRETLAKDYEFPLQGGLALLWLPAWDDSASIGFRTLDPFYIEVCRRVRLEMLETGICARTTKTPVSRIEEGEARKGRTGDLWTPIDKEGEKIMAVPKQGFRYELVTKLLTLDGQYEPAPAQTLVGHDGNTALELICQGIAPDGMSRTLGYHERRVPLSPKLRRYIAGDQRPLLARMAKRRIEAIAAMRKLLWTALALLFANGENDGGNDAISNRASRFAQPFEQQEDSRFFDDLTAHIEAEGEQQEAVYLHWLLGLAERAQAVLEAAFDAGPRSAMQRYKAQAAALSRFDSGLHGGKKPLFPELMAHYAQQRSARSTPTAGEVPCLTATPQPKTAPQTAAQTMQQQLTLL